MWNGIDDTKYRFDSYSDYRLDYNNDNRTIAGGVYERRMHEKNLGDNAITPTQQDLQSAEALKEKLSGVTVTISPETAEYMSGIRERKEAQRAEEERIRQEYGFLWNPENPFDRIGTQFSVFSDALSEMGFYDNLSDEETLQAECLLGGMTYSMNSLFGTLQEKEAVCGGLSSYAARFELESSTAALRQFSEKFVPVHMRDTFDNLIDKYYEHNAKALEGYRSSWEDFQEGNARLYDTTASKRMIPLSEEEKIIWKLGKVKTTEADNIHAAESWRTQLQKLASGEKSVDDSIAMMQDTLNALASGNSKDRGVLAYVSRWNAFSIENARQYWKLLMD
ncbi:MAG: hypothetical protein NC318_08780 [Blautia sp.]|nr:hypothetical protein [Blautia sp.]